MVIVLLGLVAFALPILALCAYKLRLGYIFGYFSKSRHFVCHDAQVINPKKDLPVGLLGSLGVVTTLYVLMAATLILLIPYTAIDPAASFAAAFAVGLSL